MESGTFASPTMAAQWARPALPARPLTPRPRTRHGAGGGRGETIQLPRRGGGRNHPPATGRGELPEESRVGGEDLAVFLANGKKPFAAQSEMCGRDHLLLRGGGGAGGPFTWWGEGREWTSPFLDSLEGVARMHLARRGRSHFLLMWGTEKEDDKT